jgi:hypothetical protein
MGSARAGSCAIVVWLVCLGVPKGEEKYGFVQGRLGTIRCKKSNWDANSGARTKARRKMTISVYR